MSGVFDRFSRSLRGQGAAPTDGGGNKTQEVSAASAAGASSTSQETSTHTGEASLASATGAQSPDSGLDPRVLAAAEVEASAPVEGSGSGNEGFILEPESGELLFGNGTRSETPDVSSSNTGDDGEDDSGPPEGYRPGNDYYTEERDTSEYRPGNEPYTEERDTSEYRDGNALPPQSVGELGYRSDDVVVADSPESASAQARMTDTVVDEGSEEAASAGDTGFESVADAPIGAGPGLLPDDIDMISAPADGASSGVVPNEEMSLNYEAVEYDYAATDKEGGGALPGGTGGYEVEKHSVDGGADESDGSAAMTAEPVGGLEYSSEDVVVADSPESAPVQARMTDTVVDEDKEAAAEKPVGDEKSPDSDAGDADDEGPLTLIKFDAGSELEPAVIEDTGAELEIDGGADFGELDADGDVPSGD